MKTDRNWVAVGASVLVLGSLVSTADSAEGQSVVRDSAGIRVVSGDGVATWPEDRGWTLGAAARVISGDDVGAGLDPLFGVVGAARTRSGTIAIANGGYKQLQFHMPSRSGHVTGGEGDGPGEFRQLVWIRAYRGDSIAVYDQQHRRVSVYTDEGVLAREFVVGQGLADQQLQLVATLSDGSFLAAESGIVARPLEREVVRRGTELVVYSSEGSRGRVLSRVPGSELIVGPFGGASFTGELPFGVRTCVAVGRGKIVIAKDGSLAYETLTDDGDLRMRVRTAVAPEPLSESEVEEFVRWRLEEYAGSSAQGFIAAVLDDTPFPEAVPARGQILVDSEGYVWVERLRRGRSAYVVFDEEGVLLGAVAVPPGLVVDQVENGVLLGHRSDALGIERVELYELNRSTGGAPVESGQARAGDAGWIGLGWGSRPYCLR